MFRWIARIVSRKFVAKSSDEREIHPSIEAYRVTISKTSEGSLTTSSLKACRHLKHSSY